MTNPAAASRREAIVVAHTGRADVSDLVCRVITRLQSAGVTVYVPEAELESLPAIDAQPVPEPSLDPHQHTPGLIDPEFVLVLGGDGTFLRGAEYARPSGAPILGVNLGRVGFLAETESDALDEAVGHLLDGSYAIEGRMTLNVEVIDPGHPDPGHPDAVRRTWALNEASLEKSQRERILEVAIAVAGHPLTSFGCDGVLCATPTGSTAYAFSAGGPIMWPLTEAMLVVPNAAHALFARPLVVDPDTEIQIDIAPRGHDGVLAADGRRLLDVPAGHRVLVRRGATPVNIARFNTEDFASRLVTKFHLPTTGFRDGRVTGGA